MLEPLASWDAEATWELFDAGTFHVEHAGVELQKSEHDLLRYRELIETSQPDIVVETGTRAGGSALWFRDQGLQVVTIDRQPQFDHPPYVGPGVEWVTGNSLASSVINRVAPLLRGKRVMVSLDSDHHRGHVLNEMMIWGQFVSPGCYIVIEDGCFDLWEPERARRGGRRIPEEGGALAAMRESDIEYSRGFWRDASLEGRSSISHSPCGWWRAHE